MKTTKAPNALSLRSSLEFCKILQSLDVEIEHAIDFATTGSVEPCGMLMVSSELQRLQTRCNLKVDFENYRHMTYAGHMGFFKAFSHEYGKWPGEANGGNNYIPLTILDTGQIRKEAIETLREEGDVVEERSKQLASTLIGDDTGEVFETLAYSIREIIRNVVEHSGASQIGLCGQYWPSKGRAEIAIIDRGRGLGAALAPNPHIDASTDKQAINWALMPAISGVAFEGAKKPNRDSPWVNSGFGLYMTNRICRNGGNFFISSGDTGMLLTASGEGKRYFSTSHKGTVVRMIIDTNQRDSLQNSLERYRNEGYEIQQKYKEVVRIDPSAASLMLSKDFDVTLWDKLLSKLKGR